MILNNLRGLREDIMALITSGRGDIALERAALREQLEKEQKATLKDELFSKGRIVWNRVGNNVLALQSVGWFEGGGSIVHTLVVMYRENGVNFVELKRGNPRIDSGTRQIDVTSADHVTTSYSLNDRGQIVTDQGRILGRDEVVQLKNTDQGSIIVRHESCLASDLDVEARLRIGPLGVFPAENSILDVAHIFEDRIHHGVIQVVMAKT